MTHRWKWIAGAVAVLLAGVTALGWSLSRPEPVDKASELPEWFSVDYRIRPHQPPKDMKDAVLVEGMGWVAKEEVPPPGNTTQEWFDSKFTHYIFGGAFTWATPKLRYPSLGKLLNGTKVIFGKNDGEFSLVCARTKDGRLMNMYVQSMLLLDRAKGPPRDND